MKKTTNKNRFQALFKTDVYPLLKNYFYNYLLRKKAVAGFLEKDASGWILEVGAGISPVSDNRRSVVFSDVSKQGMQTLKKMKKEGAFVVADATALPFKSRSFKYCIGSEVVEHIDDDQLALQEMSRVLSIGGRCIITFPHRTAYHSIDDVYVDHRHRYNLSDMYNKLNLAGLFPLNVQAVLGPLDKIMMISAVFIIKLVDRKQRQADLMSGSPVFFQVCVPVFKWTNRLIAVLAWIDEKIVPQSMSTVILIESERMKGGSRC